MHSPGTAPHRPPTHCLEAAVTIHRIDPQTAHHLLTAEGHCYIDIRSELEFSLGHPAGAYNIPYHLDPDEGGGPNPDFLTTIRRNFASDKKLIVGCRAGIDSLTAARRLAASGYTVVELRPGFEGRRDPFGQTTEVGWRAAGLPCAMDADPGHDYASLSRETYRDD